MDVGDDIPAISLRSSLSAQHRTRLLASQTRFSPGLVLHLYRGFLFSNHYCHQGIGLVSSFFQQVCDVLDQVNNMTPESRMIPPLPFRPRQPWFAFWCWPWWIWAFAVVFAPIIYLIAAPPGCYAIDCTTSVPLPQRTRAKSALFGAALWCRQHELAYREVWDFEWFFLIETFGQPGQ